MQMKFLMFFTSLFLFLNAKNELNTYCNARFGYCINYPKFLIAQPESQNGDGRIFTNKEGQKILTGFGRLNQDADGNAISLNKQYTSDIQELSKAKSNISYQKLGKDFYILSGHKNGKIFYQKMIVKNDTFCFAILEYQDSDKPIYDSVSVDIFKSFK